jgi:two-component system, NarL family, response regulator YdfI
MQKAKGEQRIRVLVSASSAVSRSGLESIVRNSALLELSGSFAGLAHLGLQPNGLHPDVLLAELNRAELELFGRSQTLSFIDSSIPIVVLMDRADARWIARALRGGVKGILPRNGSSEEIVWAIQAAKAGLFLLDKDTAQVLTPRFGSEPFPERTQLIEELTEREIEILRKLAEGLGNKQIASGLAISEHTVKFHISSILDKLGASTRTEAVTIGIRLGLVLL